MIAGLRDRPDQQVLIVAPDLEQVRALIASAARHGVRLYQPLSNAAATEDRATGTPFNFLHETKRDALQALIQYGCNVITTHKLYSEIAQLARLGMLREVEVHIDEILSVSDEATSITQCSRSKQAANDWRSLYVGNGYAAICPETGRITPTDNWRQKRDDLAGNPNANVARFLGCDNKKHADAYAVAEMIQFIWRSRIRDRKPITLYMPCPKMRRLWARWLDGEL